MENIEEEKKKTPLEIHLESVENYKILDMDWYVIVAEDRGDYAWVRKFYTRTGEAMPNVRHYYNDIQKGKKGRYINVDRRRIYLW